MIGPGELTKAFWAHGRCDDCPVIDMHGHMGPFRGIYLPRCEAEGMIRSMDGIGCRLVVFSHHTSLSCPEIGNVRAIEAVRKHPERLRAYMCVNPHYSEAIAKDLGAFDGLRDVFVGLKIHPTWHETPMDSPAYERAWSFANERGLIVLSHTWGGSDTCGAEQVRKIASKYARVRLLLGHSLHGQWDKAVAVARDLPNVYLDLCAVPDDRGPLEMFVAAGLSERILFGTDLPWFDLHYYVGTVLSAEITDEDRRNILYRNARRLLAWTGADVPRGVLSD